MNLEDFHLIKAYVHAIQSTWNNHVSLKPNRKRVVDFRSLVMTALSEVAEQDRAPLNRIIEALNRADGKDHWELLTPEKVMDVRKVVDLLPMPGRRADDANESDRPLVLILDGYGETATSLGVNLSKIVAEVMSVPCPDHLSQALLENHGKAAMMIVGANIVRSPDSVETVRLALEAFRTKTERELTVIFATDTQPTFAERMVAARMGQVRIFRADDDPRIIRDVIRSTQADNRLAGSKVLLIEDSVTDAYKAQQYMAEAGLVVEHVQDPFKVLEAVARFQPDLIVSDFHMPGVNGDIVASIIRQDPECTMPIVFLSSESDTEKQLLALAHGADGFIQKPLQRGAFVKAVKSMIMRSKSLDRRMRRDPLTNLLNHGQILESARRVSSSGQQACLALIDVDHFKAVNDTYGHPMGDVVLSKIGEVLSCSMRTSDYVGRLGGEEFAIVLTGVGLEQAGFAINRVREIFQEVHFAADDGTSLSCTFSVGITALRGRVATALKEADEALYRAKHGGRNQVVLFESDPVVPGKK